MADRSKIEWTDATFNPWIGCTKVSPGCDNCYAAQQDSFRKWTPAGWGAGQPRKRTAPSTWKHPKDWNDEAFFECADCGFRGTARDMGAEPKGPCSHGVTKQVRRRVFCASLADVFDNEVPDDWRDDLWELIERCGNLDWLLLTKRIGNVAKMMPAHLAAFPRNVWLGATIVNQEEADRDIPKLLATPARVRFLSVEPLLGPVNLWLPTRTFETGRGPHGTEKPILMCDHCCNGDRCDDPTHHERGRPEWQVRCPYCRGTGRGRPIDWVIVGGESGPKARPMHPDWARSLRDQCKAAGVPFLFKQWGEWTPGEVDDPADGSRYWVDEFGTGVNIEGRQQPTWMGEVAFCRVGKTKAGRSLDQRTHDGFPEVAHA